MRTAGFGGPWKTSMTKLQSSWGARRRKSLMTSSGGEAMIAKREVLTYIKDFGPTSSAELAEALHYVTRSGAAATLLRLHRHGHLRRSRDQVSYQYTLSGKGHDWLFLFGEGSGHRLPRG